jgi:two-component system response regulator FixJ
MTTEAVVHLIDDDEAVRRALAFLLGTAGLAVKVYESADALLEKFSGAQSGCVVSDVRMPGMNGIELLKVLRQRNFTLPVIIMTGHADVALAVEAMKAGAADFIEKPFDDEAFIAAIQMALSRKSSRQENSDSEGIRIRLAKLSQRERQVLDGLVAGLPNKTIAYDLGLSPRTVEVHRAAVMRKMAASSLSELVRMSLAVQE